MALRKLNTHCCDLSSPKLEAPKTNSQLTKQNSLRGRGPGNCLQQSKRVFPINLTINP